MEKVDKEDIIELRTWIGKRCPMRVACSGFYCRPEWVMEAKLMNDFCHKGKRRVNE